MAVVQPLTLNRIAQKIHSPPGTGTGSNSSSGVMTTFVPKANCNMMMMTSSTIVTSFDETDDMTETEVDDSCCNTGSDVIPEVTSAPPVGQLASKTATTLSNFSRMSSEETSSLFYNMKTSL